MGQGPIICISHKFPVTVDADVVRDPVQRLTALTHASLLGSFRSYRLKHSTIPAVTATVLLSRRCSSVQSLCLPTSPRLALSTRRAWLSAPLVGFLLHTSWQRLKGKAKSASQQGAAL